MTNFINKTFRGLTKEYYFRQVFFGALIGGVMYATRHGEALNPGVLAWVGVNTLLYPYARFVWEGIVGFIMGSNVFFLPAIVLLIAKCITMFLCWQLAIVIAPIGLAYLYWHHSRGVSAS